MKKTGTPKEVAASQYGRIESLSSQRSSVWLYQVLMWNLIAWSPQVVMPRRMPSTAAALSVVMRASFDGAMA